MRRRAPIYLTICLLPFFLLAACERQEKVKVAVMTKLEAGSIVGSSEVNAAKMFLADHHVNNIEIIPFDDAWQPEKTKAAFGEVRKQGIRFLITSHVSTCAVAIAEDINKDRILTFVTGATTDSLSRKDDYILRNVQDVEEEQKSIAEYINRMPQKKLLVIRDTDNHGYTTPALKYFQSFVAKDKVRVLDISISKLDLDALAPQLHKENYELLYLLIGGYKSAAGSIAQLAKKLGPDVKIIYTPWMKTPTLLETAGSSIKDSIMPSHYPQRPESPAIRSYIERFKSRYNYAPTFISLNVYVALQILAEAINAGNRTPEQVKDYILNKGAFITEFGKIVFDKYGDTRMTLYFIRDIPNEF